MNLMLIYIYIYIYLHEIHQFLTFCVTHKPMIMLYQSQQNQCIIILNPKQKGTTPNRITSKIIKKTNKKKKTNHLYNMQKN
jgi:hypothetical protein